jgi:hypothetical protein
VSDLGYDGYDRGQFIARIYIGRGCFRDQLTVDACRLGRQRFEISRRDLIAPGILDHNAFVRFAPDGQHATTLVRSPANTSDGRAQRR